MNKARAFLQENVSRETFKKLEIYVGLLEKWQAHINLVSRGTLEDVWQRHILDSWQITRVIPHKKTVIADLGAGAGFPGLVLAMSGFENLTLVESNHKKAGFMTEVARCTDIKVNIISKRIEDASLEGVDVFVSRAMASLSVLFDLVWPFTHPETSCIFLKGRTAEEEIGLARNEWDFDVNLYPSLTDDFGRILEIKNLIKRL